MGLSTSGFPSPEPRDDDAVRDRLPSLGGGDHVRLAAQLARPNISRMCVSLPGR